ncbi:MAG: hypothetical protein K0U84_13415 [Actinomycetia bacterium]|nr:hypothetical protein [Actinomycetes bacterium]
MSSKSNELRGTWRTAMGKTYLAGEDFERDQEMELEIESVTREKVTDPGTNKEKQLITVHFIGTPRVLALNVTNARRISEQVGSPRVEKWAGHKITLMTEFGKAFGKDAWMIRVKP